MQYNRFKAGFYRQLNLNDEIRTLIKILNLIQKTEGCG